MPFLNRSAHLDGRADQLPVQREHLVLVAVRVGGLHVGGNAVRVAVGHGEPELGPLAREVDAVDLARGIADHEPLAVLVLPPERAVGVARERLGLLQGRLMIAGMTIGNELRKPDPRNRLGACSGWSCRSCGGCRTGCVRRRPTCSTPFVSRVNQNESVSLHARR